MSQLLTCPYDNLVVLDIETSGDEIVKLAFALYNTRTQRVEDNLVQVVKPTSGAAIPTSLIESSGLTQQQVDDAQSLPTALQAVHTWLHKNGLIDTSLADTNTYDYRSTAKSWAFVTFGDNELQTILPKQTQQAYTAHANYYKQWINLQAVYRQIYKDDDQQQQDGNGPVTLQNMLKFRQITPVPRSPSSTVMNMATLCTTIINDGFAHMLTTTGSYKDKTTSEDGKFDTTQSGTDTGVVNPAGQDFNRGFDQFNKPQDGVPQQFDHFRGGAYPGPGLKICYAFQENGYCRFGDRCRYSHGGAPPGYNPQQHGFSGFPEQRHFGHEQRFGGGPFGDRGGFGFGGRHKICFAFKETGTCSFGDRCKYSHDGGQTPGTGPFHHGGFGGGGFSHHNSFGQPKICYAFQQDGTCRFGDSCRYAHHMDGPPQQHQPPAFNNFNNFSAMSHLNPVTHSMGNLNNMSNLQPINPMPPQHLNNMSHLNTLGNSMQHLTTGLGQMNLGGNQKGGNGLF